MALEIDRLGGNQNVVRLDLRREMLDNTPQAVLILVVEHVKPSVETIQSMRPYSDRFIEATHNKSPIKSNLQRKKSWLVETVRTQSNTHVK